MTGRSSSTTKVLPSAADTPSWSVGSSPAMMGVAFFTAATSIMKLYSEAVAGSTSRRQAYTKSWAVTGSPFIQLASWRMRKV